MAEWYKDWFNTKYYHILYQNRDQEEARRFIQKLIGHLQIPLDSHILDLACGTGRHAIQLHQLGYQVLGVDLSEHSIAEAKESEKEGLRFARHDMRDPIQGETFQAVFNLFTSFGYFRNVEDNQKVISAVSSYLAPGGIFLIDFLNADLVKQDLNECERKEIDGISFIINREIKDGFVSKTIDLEDQRCNMQFKEEVRLFTLADFQEMLGKAGFEIDEIYGDYQLSDFDKNVSERLIIKAVLK